MCKNRNFVTKHGIILVLAMVFSSSILFGQNHFSGFAGIAGNMGADDDGKFQLTTDAFFAGQFDLLGRFQLRTGASIRTENLFTNEFLQNVPSFFSVDELSLTVRLPSQEVSHYLALFAGEYESIGSDLFLQRQFGILPVASRVSETWLGLNGTTIYPFEGFGGSYVLRLKTPQALGAYFYVNEKEDLRHMNFDTRFAGVFPLVTLDLSVGIGFPVETKDSSGENVVLLIRKMELHTGVTSVIGNEHTASLFFQFGLNKVIFNPDEAEKVLKLSDLYFLIEPRFKVDFMNFHFTMFNMPQRLMDDLFFISNPLGCNLAIFAENLHAGIFNFTVGAHLTLSAYGMTLDNFNNITSQNISLKLAPFAETPFGTGTLMTRFTIDFMRFSEIHKSMKFTLGYKSRL